MSHQRVAWVVLGLTHFLFTQTTTPGGRVPGPQPSQGVWAKAYRAGVETAAGCVRLAVSLVACAVSVASSELCPSLPSWTR